MVKSKRSEALVSVVPGWPWFALLVLALGGCSLAPDLEDIVDKQFKYEEMNLTPSALAERIQEVDANYAETRTPTKVQLSYERSLDCISRVNNYEALWRGVRACAWLSMNHTDKSLRREYAIKGVLMGKEAVKKTSTRVEPHYYMAICLGAIADIRGTASRELLQMIRDRMQLALSIDERYDYCGPHRFLGEFMVRTAPYPLMGVGDAEGGLAHLKKATEVCPDYGENHLAYARMLKEQGEDALAKAELEKVLACPKPKDLTAEHQQWLEEATKLLTELVPNS